MFLYRMIWSVCHVCIGSNPLGNSPKRNILLQSGCNFLMPITKCWFGISEFLRLAAVSDFFDNLLKKPAGPFPSLTIISKKKNLLLAFTRQDARLLCEQIFVATVYFKIHKYNLQHRTNYSLKKHTLKLWNSVRLHNHLTPKILLLLNMILII